jgi:expansin (peptidoglycan-binding protein)
MIKLEYFDGKNWISCGEFQQERLAWMSLNDDDRNYRTVDATGKVLTDKSKPNNTLASAFSAA